MTSATNDETTKSAAGPAAVATVELTEDALVAAAQVVPAGSPVVMVNLLHFREVADYGEGSERGAVPAGASGRAAYLDGYVPAFSEIAAQEGVEVEIAFCGQVHAALVAPAAERWDDVVLVRCPNLVDFRKIVGSAACAQQAEHHRTAALEDSRLIATSPLADPSS